MKSIMALIIIQYDILPKNVYFSVLFTRKQVTIFIIKAYINYVFYQYQITLTSNYEFLKKLQLFFLML